MNYIRIIAESLNDDFEYEEEEQGSPFSEFGRYQSTIIHLESNGKEYALIEIVLDDENLFDDDTKYYLYKDGVYEEITGDQAYQDLWDYRYSLPKTKQLSLNNKLLHSNLIKYYWRLARQTGATSTLSSQSVASSQLLDSNEEEIALAFELSFYPDNVDINQIADRDMDIIQQKWKWLSEDRVITHFSIGFRRNMAIIDQIISLSYQIYAMNNEGLLPDWTRRKARDLQIESRPESFFKTSFKNLKAYYN